MIKEIPDLILLDIMMPGIDGYEVCKKMKESSSTSSLPIVFISAKVLFPQLGKVTFCLKFLGNSGMMLQQCYT